LNYFGADEVKSVIEEEFSADKLMKVDKEAFQNNLKMQLWKKFKKIQNCKKQLKKRIGIH
jgi:hypothetical protein